MTDRTILLSFAHPDDETFLTGGTICKYVAEGVRVVLSSATLGQAGKVGEPPVCTREELPAVREAELRSAARILGIHEIVLLGYHDRELATVPVPAIREQLVDLIRTNRPQIVLTFDPNGSNLHPDHIAISRFTSDAVVAAADERFFPGGGAPYAVPRLVWTTPGRSWELLRVDRPESVAGVDFIIDVSRWRERKEEALRAHRTQHLNWTRVFFSQPDVDRLLSVEGFRQAWGPELKQRPAPDLFAGL